MWTVLLPVVLASLLDGSVTRSRAALQSAVELSFSPVPFLTEMPPPGFRQKNPRDCVTTTAECSYLDRNGVEHVWFDGVLVIKIVDVRRAGRRPIDALGIGRARAMPEVLARVRRFVPEVEVDCSEERLGEDAVVCEGSLDEGWFKLIFDESGQLTQARVDIGLLV